MKQVSLNAPAPGFDLVDTEGNNVRLSDYVGKRIVLLVFNRGFL